MSYIGIDLGTSSVKLLLMCEHGTVLNTVSKEYPVFYPKEGWSEQNPADWYEAVMEGIKELIAGEDKTKISGISIAGQMHGLVILDEADEVIRPCILWNDGRSAEECEYLNQRIGTDMLSKYTANIAFAGFTAPKLLWLSKHEPENFKKIRKIMLPKDYLAYRMTGIFGTDVSDASGTLYFDVKNRCWSKEMCNICGISEEMLPKIYESYEKTGCIKREVAETLGIKETVIMAAGAGDNAAAAVSTGTIGGGKCNISLGTSGTIFISSEEFSVDEKNALHSFCNSDGKYHLMGCMLSAASCNKWWMEDIIGTTDYKKEQEKITDEKLGENSVFFLPYLMGERSPHNDPDARGVFFGMSLAATREDLTQAVLEGVAFAFRDSLEIAGNQNIKIDSTKICGGGAKSELWIQIIANVLNVKVDILENEEGPSLGAAILAAVADGRFASVEAAAKKIVKVAKTIEPDKVLVEKYDKKYKKFKEIYPACRDIFKL